MDEQVDKWTGRLDYSSTPENHLFCTGGKKVPAIYSINMKIFSLNRVAPYILTI